METGFNRPSHHRLLAATADVPRRPRQGGLRIGGDGVADDLVGVAVFDRAQVQLALAGSVLGYVGEPHQVRGGRGELVPDPPLVIDDSEQVVVDRRAGLAGLAPLAGVGGEHARDRAQPPDPVLRRDDADIGGLVGQEPVTQLSTRAGQSETRFTRRERLHGCATRRQAHTHDDGPGRGRPGPSASVRLLVPVQSPELKAASNAAVGAAKAFRRTNSSASGAPTSRSIPASSHSTEMGPS